MGSGSSSPWLCTGLFNEILLNNKKIGGIPRSFSKMAALRVAVDVCHYVDIGFTRVLGLWGPKIPLCARRLNRMRFNCHARWHRVGAAPHVYPPLSVGLYAVVMNCRGCLAGINQGFKEIKLRLY